MASIFLRWSQRGAALAPSRSSDCHASLRTRGVPAHSGGGIGEGGEQPVGQRGVGLREQPERARRLLADPGIGVPQRHAQGGHAGLVVMKRAGQRGNRLECLDEPERSRGGRAVLIELERRGMTVTYLRTPEGHEVDFLARSAAGETELLQVVSDATDLEVAEPEIRALEEAGRLYPQAIRRLLTSTRDALPRDVPEGILSQPAYEWMLTNTLQ